MLKPLLRICFSVLTVIFCQGLIAAPLATPAKDNLGSICNLVLSQPVRMFFPGLANADLISPEVMARFKERWIEYTETYLDKHHRGQLFIHWYNSHKQSDLTRIYLAERRIMLSILKPYLFLLLSAESVDDLFQEVSAAYLDYLQRFRSKKPTVTPVTYLFVAGYSFLHGVSAIEKSLSDHVSRLSFGNEGFRWADWKVLLRQYRFIALDRMGDAPEEERVSESDQTFFMARVLLDREDMLERELALPPDRIDDVVEQFSAALAQVVSQLQDKYKDNPVYLGVLNSRILADHPLSFQELSRIYGFSISRLLQIDDKLRRYLRFHLKRQADHIFSTPR